MSNERKIACLFPGIGYTCDKPLLYYSWKLLKGMGWDVVPVPYAGFPEKVKGNPEKMKLSAEMALEQAEEILREIEWDRYGEILFVGKSVGTVVCGAYASVHGIDCRRIRECCREQGIPLYETEGANHSLETGDVEKDIKELRKVMKIVRDFAGDRKV